MKTNELPKYDMSDNSSGCCPKFNLTAWDEQELSFEKKLFIKAKTRSLFHIPLNIGSVFPKAFQAMKDANAYSEDNFVTLSHDPSCWRGEHYFAVTKPVTGYETVEMTGNFLTKVFEGPYKDAPKWMKEMEQYVQSKDRKASKIYFFYTTCPKCAKIYGKNYVVAIAEIQ